MTRPDLMISKICAQGGPFSARIEKAFRRVDRAGFVLPKYFAKAYDNRPLSIGFGQFISQPYTVAFMLELLNVKKGEKVLEIGSGCGWQTALLAYLVGSQGKVVAIERIKKLALMTMKNLCGFPGLARSCYVVWADGKKGFKAQAPYNAVVAAATTNKFPVAWKKQLKIGGRIVAPLGQSIIKLTKISANKWTKETYPGFIFVPLK